MLKRIAIGSHRDVAKAFRIFGVILSYPMAFEVSSSNRASKVSLAVMTMLLNWEEGVGNVDDNLKLLEVNVELKNLLNALELAWGV